MMQTPTMREIRQRFDDVGFDLVDPRRGADGLYTVVPQRRGTSVGEDVKVGRGRSAYEAAENAWQLFEQRRYDRPTDSRRQS
jgi:hypothetical protein